MGGEVFRRQVLARDLLGGDMAGEALWRWRRVFAKRGEPVVHRRARLRKALGAGDVAVLDLGLGREGVVVDRLQHAGVDVAAVGEAHPEWK